MSPVIPALIERCAPHTHHSKQRLMEMTSAPLYYLTCKDTQVPEVGSYLAPEDVARFLWYGKNEPPGTAVMSRARQVPYSRC